MSHLEWRDTSGARLGNILIETGTISGPASYAAGGFTTTLSTFSSLKGAMVMTTAALPLVVGQIQVSTSGNTFTIKCFDLLGGQVAAAVNLSAMSFGYWALGTV